jgi:hypothetical protein
MFAKSTSNPADAFAGALVVLIPRDCEKPEKEQNAKMEIR